ncbi:AMP-binding protein [Rhodococcus erythropolis]|uniref:AMP-binding protein n=1 Tax=Rhodococcus erythropolis TaxID=1833 RepID=UPI003013A5AB
MNIANWLAAAGLERPTTPALFVAEDPISNYQQFAGRACATAATLRTDFAVAPGDRVAIFGANHPDYLVAMFAVWWAGGVVVPVNAKLHPREVATIVRDCGARVLLTNKDDTELREQVTTLTERDFEIADLHEVSNSGADQLGAPVERTTEDLAWIFYTSGTTGAPKGAMLSHGNLAAASLSYLADVTNVDPATSYLYAAPISHGAGLYAPIHVRMGARHVFAVAESFDPDEVLDLAAKMRQMSFFAAPTMVRRLTKSAKAQGSAGPGLGTIVYGGGPMYLPDIVDALETFGPCLAQIYGQGESPMTVCALRKEQHLGDDPKDLEHRLRSVGTAHSVVDVRVVGASGGPSPTGAVGEIEVRGATVMAGYWGNPDATADTVRNGWLRTGDLGSLDALGFLTLAGRSKEVVISGGSNVYPREVEDVLMTHPDVDEAAVLGEADDEWGEIVVAFVVPTTGRIPTTEDLDRHCLTSLARFKRPKKYVFVDDLPKNAYGKVLKTTLADDLTRLDHSDNSAKVSTT